MANQETKQKEKLLGFLIDVEAGKAEPILFENDLNEIYKLLNCSLIDIQESCIEGVDFDFIIDDEGALKDNPKPSAFTKSGEPWFVGNLLICHSDPKTGKQTGLNQKDIVTICKHLVLVGKVKEPEGLFYKAINDLEL